MARGGSWILPIVNGQPDLAKPPLVYWLTATLYFFFNPSPFIRRFWMIIFGLGLVTITYSLAKHWYSKKVAFWSAIFLATSAPLIYFSKTGNFDLPNAFFTTLTIYLYNLAKKSIQSEDNETNSVRRRRDIRFYLLLTSISFALGLLTRSFLALTPLIVIVFDYIFFRQRRFSKLAILNSLFIILAITLPWHIFAYQQAPNIFLNQYLNLPFIYHLGKVLPGDFHSSPLFYLRILLLFPPTIFAVIQIIKQVRQVNRSKFPRQQILKSMDCKSFQLTSWIVVFFMALTISTTRHIWYTLPLYPPLSILAGLFITNILKNSKVSVIKFLTKVFTIAMIATTPTSLFISPLPESEVITAVNIMQKKSQPNEILYEFHYPLVPVTRFFPTRSVEIIENKEVARLSEKQSIFILARTNDLKLIPSLRKDQLLYQSSQFTLFKTTR